MTKKDIIFLFKKTSLFKTKELKNIKDTCCQSPMKVIDFEDVTNAFYSLLGLDLKLSSVDAMLIDNEWNIYLIEMKGMKDADFLNIVDDKILDTCIKLTDSIKTLMAICGHFEAPKEAFKLMVSSREVKIFPYLLTNISSRLLHQKEWSELEKKKKLRPSSRLSSPIEILNCNSLEEDFKNHVNCSDKIFGGE